MEYSTHFFYRQFLYLVLKPVFALYPLTLKFSPPYQLKPDLPLCKPSACISNLYLHNALYAFISAFSMLCSYSFCNALNSCIGFSYSDHPSIAGGLAISFTGAYYCIVKAGIPYRDPQLELQIQYAVNIFLEQPCPIILFFVSHFCQTGILQYS